MVKRYLLWANVVISLFLLAAPFNILFPPSLCWAQTDSTTKQPEMLSCEEALKKLDNSIENCSVTDIVEINAFYEESGLGCLQRVLSKKNEEFFLKCLDYEKGASQCRLDKILATEDFLEKNQEQMKTYRLLREKVLRAKCVNFFNSCVKTQIEDAYKRRDIKAVAKIEKKYKYSFKVFSNCADFKNIRKAVLDKKSEYFNNYLATALRKSLKTGDLKLLMKTRDLTIKFFENCEDYSAMIARLEKTMCAFYQQWYQITHEKIVTDCDFELLKLIDTFGTAKELGYCQKIDFQMDDMDMEYNKEEVANTKCKILLKCGQERVKTIADGCNINQLQKMYKIITSCEGSRADKKAVKKVVCLPLTDCFINDLSAAAYNCNYKHMEKIVNSLDLLDDYDCDTRDKVEQTFENAKQEFSKCINRNLEIAKSLCDFDRVVDIQRFLKLPFWGEELDEYDDAVEKTIKVMATHCLEPVLKMSVFSCDYSIINKLMGYARDGLLENISKKKLAELIDNTKSEFCQKCLEEEIEATFESCQVEIFFKWEDIVRKEFNHFPQAPKLIEKIQKQKNLIFDHCLKGEIIKAQRNLNISLIQDYEEIVEKHLGDLADIKEYRAIIRKGKNYGIGGGM